jgi:hypothetical protein
MKTLSLYIDRWYIAAAVCYDNIPRRIDLPNREDRIWLYFYEDINNDRVIYGKSYQKHYLDKELHYYGDIFSKVVKEDETFKRFGKDVSLKEIFKASDILEHLTRDFNENEKIDTYISFSVDVSYAAQKVFLDILEENNFVIKESVARISHLAVELSNKKGLLNDSNCILVIIACNENLRYVVYKQSNNVFVRQGNEGLLRGYGTDLRGRALLEQIVWQINNSTKFLRKEEEEINRLNQNLERWLLQLDNTKFGRPVIYNDITFSRAPHNKQNATILKNVIEERTKTIVNDVVDNIVQYVKELDIVFSDISHIIFIGDSFKNSMFKEELLQRYPVTPNNIVAFGNKDIPEIVGIYSQMDLSQFDSLRKNIENLSYEQLEQIKIAEEDRKAREAALKKQEEIDLANAAMREDERKFNAAIVDAESYEKKGDYSSMIDLLNIALTLKPDDKEVKKMLDEANRKLSEIKVKNEQYNKTIRMAQDALNSQRWQDAYSKSEAALELRPDSSEAKRILTESQRKIKLTESLKEFLLRADTFIGQKLYKEALEELNKAKHADSNNKEIEERISKIQNIQKKHKEELGLLEQELTKAEKEDNFDIAIEICNKLIDKDIQNPRKWNEHIVYLKERRNKYLKDIELFESLKIKINEASFNEHWEELIELCNKALSIKSDDSIKRYLEKAQDKFKLIQDQKNFESLVSNVKTFIADRQWPEAKEIIKVLHEKYPDRSDIIRNLRKQIFDAEEAWEDKLSGKKHISSPMPNNTEEYGKPPVKIDRPSKDSSFDDFFGTDNPKGKDLDQTKETPYKTSRQKKESSGDDFFGSDSPKGNSLGQNKGKSVPSNTNSQKKESSGDSFFDSDSSKLEKSKQKQHTKPSAKDDFFKS